MVKVQIWGSLAATVGGQTELEVQALNLKGLLSELATVYPELQPQLEQGVSVAIDGRIYNDSWFTPIHEDSEVVLLQRIVGG